VNFPSSRFDRMTSFISVKTPTNRWRQFAALLAACSTAIHAQTHAAGQQSIFMPQYSVTIQSSEQPGGPPQLKLEREHQVVFNLPMVAGLASTSSEEHLSDITYSIRKSGENAYELSATARSNLWRERPFSVALLPRPYGVPAVRRRTRQVGALLLPFEWDLRSVG